MKRSLFLTLNSFYVLETADNLYREKTECGSLSLFDLFESITFLDNKTDGGNTSKEEFIAASLTSEEFVSHDAEFCNVLSKPSSVQINFANPKSITDGYFQDKHKILFLINQDKDKEYLQDNYDRIVSICNRSGIECIYDFGHLSRYWIDYVHKGDETYTWERFFGRNSVPVANSAIIIDRYLFQRFDKKKNDDSFTSVDGWNNVTELIKELKGCQNVLVVFDNKQLFSENEKKNTSQKLLDRKDLKDRIQEIKREICEKLSESLQCRTLSLQLEFLCIEDSVKEKMDGKWKWKDESLHTLYGLTHDRKMITNNYTIHASHSFVLRNDYYPEKPKIKDSQILIFEGMLSGYNNPDHVGELPFFKWNEFLSNVKSDLQNLKDGCVFIDSKGDLYSDNIVSRITNPLFNDVENQR